MSKSIATAEVDRQDSLVHSYICTAVHVYPNSITETNVSSFRLIELHRFIQKETSGTLLNPLVTTD